MEIKEFNQVLSKALDIVDIGIKKGYFDANRSEELNNKLFSIIKNGIIYDLPGTAVYGMYSPSEKKLYFNAKVFKNEEEALVYILHEIKHSLDHYGEEIGFENNDIGVGTNEGATQRFATDMAEEILKIKFPIKKQTSLGIRCETTLEEYQIEDKLNELFCLSINISIEEFIKLQNNPQKEKYKKLIDQFNQYANFEIFRNALDEIYKIQEETWFDENHCLLEKEKEPTKEQTERAMKLINSCKRELLKYAKKGHISVVDKLKEPTFIAINKYGEIIRDSCEEENLLNQTTPTDTMTEENIVAQANYILYHKNIIKQLNSHILNNDCEVVFVTEFGYEQQNCNKIVYFRKGEVYHKIIIPVLSDKNLDIANSKVQKVADINEIKDAIADCEAEFGVVANALEYIRILKLAQENEKAQNILNQWKYYVSKQGDLEHIRQRVVKRQQAFQEEMARIRNTLVDDDLATSQQSYFDNIFKKEIVYNNIMIDEEGITIINADGSLKLASSDEEEHCLITIKEAVANGSLTLNRVQLNLLNSYTKSSYKKR